MARRRRGQRENSSRENSSQDNSSHVQRHGRRATQHHASADPDNSTYTDAAESLDAGAAVDGNLPELSSTGADSSALNSPSDISLLAHTGGSIATFGEEENGEIPPDSTDELSTPVPVALEAEVPDCGTGGDDALSEIEIADEANELEDSAELEADANGAMDDGVDDDEFEFDDEVAKLEYIAEHVAIASGTTDCGAAADEAPGEFALEEEVSPVPNAITPVPNQRNTRATNGTAQKMATAPPRSLGRAGRILPAQREVGPPSFGRGRENNKSLVIDHDSRRAAVSLHAKDVGQTNLFAPTTSSAGQGFRDSFPMGNTFGSSYQPCTQSFRGYLPSQMSSPSAGNSYYNNNGAQQQTALDSLFYPGLSDNEIEARAHMLAEIIMERFGDLLSPGHDGAANFLVLQVHGVYHPHFAPFLQPHQRPMAQSLVVCCSFSQDGQGYGFVPSQKVFINEGGVSQSYHGPIDWNTLLSQRYLVPFDSYLPMLVTEALYRLRQGHIVQSPFHQSRTGPSHLQQMGQHCQLGPAQIGQSPFHPNQEGFQLPRQVQHDPSVHPQTSEGSYYLPRHDYEQGFNRMSGEVRSFQNRAPSENHNRSYAPKVESPIQRGYDSARKGARKGYDDNPSFGFNNSFGTSRNYHMYSRGNGGGGGPPSGAPGARYDDRRPNLKEPKSMQLKIPAYAGACEVIRSTGNTEDNNCMKLPVLWIREFDRLFSLSGINSAFQGICALMHLSPCLQGQYQTDVGHVNQNPLDGAAWGYTEIIQAICQHSEDPELDAYRFDRLAQWLISTFTATEMKVRQYEELRCIRQASRTVLQHNIRFRHAHFIFWHLSQRTDWRAQVPVATPEIGERYKESLRPEIREGVISSIHNAHTTRAIQNAFQDALEIGEPGAPGQINRTTILARPADMSLPNLMILAEAIERSLTEIQVQVRRQITLPPTFRRTTRRPSPLPLRQITNGPVGGARFNNLEEADGIAVDAEEEGGTEEGDDAIDSLNADALYNKAVRENRVIWTRGQLQRLLREGRCLKCGQTGHRASLCTNNPANPANFQFNNLQEVEELKDDEFLIHHLRDVCGASPVLSSEQAKNGVPHHNQH